MGNFFSTYSNLLKLNETTTWIKKSITGENNSGLLTHHRYSQLIHKIPVLGATIILHTKNDAVAFATGKSYPNQQVASKPNLDSTLAISIASEYVERKSHQHDAQEKSHLNYNGNNHVLTVSNSALAYIDLNYPNYSGSLQLTYQVNISVGNLSEAVYVNAMTGTVAAAIPLTAQTSTPGTVETTYYGRQAVEVDQTSPNVFQLRDQERGIAVTSELNGEINHSSPHFPFQPYERGGMAGEVF